MCPVDGEDHAQHDVELAREPLNPLGERVLEQRLHGELIRADQYFMDVIHWCDVHQLHPIELSE